MSAGLIKHLKYKTEQDPNTAILLAQWEFDEKLVGKALENVSGYYPHFSSHNASHSQQILVNIERLLGDNINELSATDTWLLLESAYWHDIGMLFNTDEVQEVLKDSNFLDYVESLALDNSQDLHEFAKTFHDEGWKKALVKYDHPHTGIEKYRQMVAEWFRRGHPSNSQKVVEDPFKKLGINSPRTELLPNRIYRYLGQICLSHGIGFEQVMSDLPYRQTGMGTENCHPRYVACLLRLGDLFDIDDNRFCPVMAKQVANMPALSQHHVDKHQAIREFQLDSESISITAECQTQESYIQSQHWFGWIKEEIQNQMAQWKNIVPSRNFGLLPTINKLEVVMDSPNILLDNQPMKFTLDEKKVMELLQGSNIYSSSNNVFREIIQNAIDSTLIRVWLENRDNLENRKLLENSSPYDSNIVPFFKDYHITVKAEVVDETINYEKIWKISIIDNGTGISLDDLKYIRNVGGSQKNKQRQKLIKEMPVWMKPSGAFGIGIHSVFLINKNLSDNYTHLTYKTSSIFNKQKYEITLQSPLSKFDGYCHIKEIENNTINSFGTTTEFYVKTHFNPLHDCNQSINDVLQELDKLYLRKVPNIYVTGIETKKLEHENTSNTGWIKNSLWINFNDFSTAIKLFVPETICSSSNRDVSSFIAFQGQEIYLHKENHHILDQYDFDYFIDVYGQSHKFVDLSRNDWKYLSLKLLINNLNKYIHTVHGKEKVSKLIHGFNQNKELGLNIIQNLIEKKKISNQLIEQLNFNNSHTWDNIAQFEAILIKELYHTEDITLDCQYLLLNHLNDIYEDQVFEIFQERGYVIFALNEKDTNTTLHHVIFDSDFDYMSLISNFSKDYTFIPYKLLQNQVNSYNYEPYNFIERLKEEDFRYCDYIIVTEDYDDFNKFEQFKELMVQIPSSYKIDEYFYDLNIGVLCPFSFHEEDGVIKWRDFNTLCSYVHNKLIDKTLTLEEVKSKYFVFIDFLKEETQDIQKLQDFFNSFKKY